MRRAGYVLAGGQSSRMGADKALLPWQGETLLDRIAGEVRAAAGSVALIAPPGRYPGFRGRIHPDLRPGCGPLGGIETALSVTPADWNLVAACDLPRLNRTFLRRILDAAEASHSDCLVPVSRGRLQPLTAVYHRRCLLTIRRALDEGVLRLTEVLSRLDCARWDVTEEEDEALLWNVNTPAEWEMLLQLDKGCQ